MGTKALTDAHAAMLGFHTKQITKAGLSPAALAKVPSA